MSSFKRKNPAKTKTVSYPGTRVSAASSSTVNVSTGISSLDDLLGGGLPLSCSLVIAAPDLHSSYGQLVQKYSIAEGLVSGQCVWVIDSDPEEFVKDVMWLPKAVAQQKEELRERGSDGEEEEDKVGDKVKIAWRYEQMKQFQTTVAAQTSENYCHVLDLTSRIPTPVVGEAKASGRLKLIHPTLTATRSVISSVYDQIEGLLKQDSSLPVRICIPSLGSPLCWGDLSSQDVLCFLNKLRALLRKNTHACASITLSPQLSIDHRGWLQKIAWLADASLSMSAFTADPALSTMFPTHHGIVRLYSLPSPNTLVSPSDRFSALRGLASSSSAFGGTGENNLAFRCTRKRLIFETLHLDLEGGVSERRTTAASSTSAISADGGSVSRLTESDISNQRGAGAKIDIAVEGADTEGTPGGLGGDGIPTIQPPEGKGKKAKKKVAFFSERPDLYDF